ncbi:MAG: phospho-N-acetylmuramoyl-pentapeptide-transferase, partial [Actinomycetia bacterium]|nr:phospho-N-acetylmuramoyl-pentapeptide-transferase [Actinomycetes bacterium]
MFIILLFSGKAISLLKKLKIREEIRSDGPKRHLAKSGTPTMGGILIIFSVIFSILLWGNLTNRFVLLFIITLLAYGFIGFYDDYLKIFKKKGFSALIKFILQIAISTGIAVFLYFYGADEITNLYIPFFTKPVLRMGIFFIPFSIFILVAATNAVNLTDGLDGLAIGLSMFAILPFVIFAYVTGHVKIAEYLKIPYISAAAETTVVGASILGACIGFLWFNSHPAEIFMGDTGSLSLGASIGLFSIIVKKELLLPLIGGIFVIEVVSVIIQVLY